jgi:hypothetical protein
MALRCVHRVTTYGYACSTHIDSVVAAKQRLDSSHLALDESVGEIGIVVLLER